jgi:sulfur-oxidizing protein SoxY
MTNGQVSSTAHVDRRRMLAGAAAAIGAFGLPSARAAYEDDGDPITALKHIANGRKITPGRVKLTLPELAENGNVVTLAVEVESPMTGADHVKTIHIVAEKNPLANLARFHLSPRSGRADVQTNVRLATTQTVNAIAEMSDGTLWSGTSTVLVTLSACLDGG